LADRGSLAGMDVFSAEDNVELAVLLNDVALADRTGDDSQGFFPEWLASDRSGQVCPWTFREAVSGGNILICPRDATLFRPFLTECRPFVGPVGNKSAAAGLGLGQHARLGIVFGEDGGHRELAGLGVRMGLATSGRRFS